MSMNLWKRKKMLNQWKKKYKYIGRYNVPGTIEELEVQINSYGVVVKGAQYTYIYHNLIEFASEWEPCDKS